MFISTFTLRFLYPLSFSLHVVTAVSRATINVSAAMNFTNSFTFYRRRPGCANMFLLASAPPDVYFRRRRISLIFASLSMYARAEHARSTKRGRRHSAAARDGSVLENHDIFSWNSSCGTHPAFRNWTYNTTLRQKSSHEDMFWQNVLALVVHRGRVIVCYT